MRLTILLALALSGCCGSPVRGGRTTLFARANLPTRPMATRMGSEFVMFSTCPFCYNQAIMAPRKIVLDSTTRVLVGTMQHRTVTFVCINPRCGKTFQSPNDKLVPDAAEIPPPPGVPIPSRL